MEIVLSVREVMHQFTVKLIRQWASYDYVTGLVDKDLAQERKQMYSFMNHVENVLKSSKISSA